MEATEAAMRAAKERMAGNGGAGLPKPVIAEAEDLKAKFQKIQAEVSSYRALSVENGKLEEEVARLRQENADLQGALAAKHAELQLASEAARSEAAGPLQQQLEELSMQLANSQAQLERLGEAVETAETDKAAAVKALQDEKEQLLLALSGAARRLSDLLYPPGSLPPGLSVATRLEVDMAAMPAAAGGGGGAAAAVDAAVAEAPQAPAAEPPAAPAEPAPAPQAPEAAAAASERRQRRPRGFLGWLLGVAAWWVYQALGALLLYYAAAIQRGSPPALTLEFGLGCLVVCTLVGWANRLLMPPRYAA